MDAVTLYATWPDLDSAQAGARTLVERRLAACVNLVPSVVSIYRWEGETRQDDEVLMLAKTSASRAGEARDALLEIHPYDTPCVTVLRIDRDGANPAFLEWIDQQTR